MTYCVKYEDARGWHEMEGDELRHSPANIADTVNAYNDELRRVMTLPPVAGPHKTEALRSMVRRVVVTDKETGARVCEWPAVEGKAS